MFRSTFVRASSRWWAEKIARAISKYSMDFHVPGIEGFGPVKEPIVAVELTPFAAYRARPEEEPIRSICFRDAELVAVPLIDLKRFSNEPLGW